VCQSRCLQVTWFTLILLHWHDVSFKVHVCTANNAYDRYATFRSGRFGQAVSAWAVSVTGTFGLGTFRSGRFRSADENENHMLILIKCWILDHFVVF